MGKNLSLALHLMDEEIEVQRHEGVRPRSPGSHRRGRAESGSFEPCSRSFALILALLPRHTVQALWDLPSLGPCFSI